jgi:hypothetical protein
MTRSKIRLVLVSEWLAFWALTTVVAALAPLLRSDHAIGSEQLMTILLSVSAIWIPPITLFVSFWFPSGLSTIEAPLRIDRERAIAALALNTVYLLLVLFLTVWALYLASYHSVTPELQEGESLLERLGALVRYALLASPLALAPIRWINLQRD